MSAEYDDVIENISTADSLPDVHFLVLGGADVLTYGRLLEVIAHCKKTDLFYSLSVSGHSIPRRLNDWGESWIADPCLLRFSYDGLHHDDRRGKGSLAAMRVGLNVAHRVRAPRTTQLVFSIFPGPEGNINRFEFETALNVAAEFDVELNPNFVYWNVRTKEMYKSAWANRTANQMHDLTWLVQQPGVLKQGKDKLDFLIAGGNDNNSPVCRAGSAVMNISERNNLILPCGEFLTPHMIPIPRITGGLKIAVRSPEWRAGQSLSGRDEYCEDCIRWCSVFAGKLLDCSDLAAQEYAFLGI